MSRSILQVLFAFTLLGLVTPLFADDARVSVVFTAGEASIIRDYYREHGGTQSGSKRNQKRLPPGIARNLQRGKSLPPGIAKQVLPNELNGLLPPPPKGFERVELSGKVLLVHVATQVIHDILEDAILGK